MFVHTAHGPGRVVEEQSVRGRKSFLVEGSGYKLWVDEKDLRVANEVNDDNSTTLPYDPTPQHPADMFSSESTIQPVNEIDSDETLSASDSLTFDDAEEYPYPGPSEDNFAGSSDEDEVRLMREGFMNRPPDGAHDSGIMRQPTPGYRGKHRPFPMPINGIYDTRESVDEYGPAEVWDTDDLAHAYDLGIGPANPGRKDWDDRMQDKFGPVWDENRPYPPSVEEMVQKLRQQNPGGGGESGFSRLKKRLMGGRDWPSEVDLGDNEPWAEEHQPEIKHFSRRQAAGYDDFANSQQDQQEAPEPNDADPQGDSQDNPAKPKKKLYDPRRYIDEILPAGMSSHLHDQQWSPGNWPGRAAGLYERPAGLSDKYVRVEAHVDHFSDPVQQFRDDPIGFVQKRAYMYADSVNQRLAEYVDLVEQDSSIRTAAWKDVRAKAMRLRREGRVHVKEVGPGRIYADVDGDNNTYETIVVKAGGVGPGSQSISEYFCSCDWGKWAFKRQSSYVGRLCSHGYASYLEMESRNMKAVSKNRTAGTDHYPTPEHLWEGQGPSHDEGGRPLRDSTPSEIQHLKDVSRALKRYWPKAFGSRIAGIVDDFKDWAEKENDGMIDQGAIDNYIYLCNSQIEGERPAIKEEDAEELYDALDDMKSIGGERNYDVDYLVSPGEAYKDKSYRTADVLHLRPQSLTPDFYFIEDGEDGETWIDVTKDERKTTGPDNMVKKSQILANLHYASDEELGEVVKDWAGAGDDLNKLRELSADEPDYGNRRKQNDEVRAVIDELHDRGIDASQFVAALLRTADTASDAAAEDSKKKPASESGQPSMSGSPSQTGQPGGSSSITKPDASQSAGSNDASAPATPSTPSAGKTNDLAAETKDPASVGFNGAPGSNPDRQNSGGSQPSISAGDVMSGLAQAGGTIMNALPGILQATPPILDSLKGIGSSIGNAISGAGAGANAVSGVGNAASGIANGLGGLAGGLGSLLHASNEIVQRHATPVGGFPNVQLTNQESFQGSGPNPKYWFGSSECYVDEHERERFVDVTDLDDDPIIKYTGDKPKQGPKKSSRRVADQTEKQRKKEFADNYRRQVERERRERNFSLNDPGVDTWEKDVISVQDPRHARVAELRGGDDYRPYENSQDSVDRWLEHQNLKFGPEDEEHVFDFPFGREPIHGREASRRPFVASEEDVRDDLLQAEGDEVHTLGEYHQFLDDARESGDDEVAALFEEALADEQDHAHNFGQALQHMGNSENANPKGSTLSSGGEIDESGVTNLDQVFRAGATNFGLSDWDDSRVKSYRKFVRQNGGQHSPRTLQEFLKQPHRKMNDSTVRKLQDYTSYAEQHEASRTAGFEDDGSDIVRQFQANIGNTALGANAGGRGGFSDAAIAEQARGFLRTAGRVYSLAEQRELEEESHPSGARNLKDLNLTGTHYEDAL